ncbi:MAG: DUF1844 domain-containing protein [Planctomycetia bacterium]|nr:DUF1844 domain-containing protein [Planctomycetia bacterium]
MSEQETKNDSCQHEGEHTCGCGHHHEGSCCHNHEHHNHGNENASKGIDPNNIPDMPMATPTLITVATNLATQAMVSMGIIPNPMTGKSVFLLNQAKHLIDTVQLIFDKTAGNRTDEESKTLDGIIHELHMLFIAAQNEKARRDAAGEN